MKKILLILFVFSCFNSYSQTRTTFTEVRHGDTIFKKSITETGVLDSTDRFDIAYRTVLDSVLVGDSMTYFQTNVIDTTFWKYYYFRVTGSVKDSIEINLPKLKDTLAIRWVNIMTKIKDSVGFLRNEATIAINNKAPIASPSFTGSFGYATGSGGTVTQGGNKGTAVTLNKICGQITMVNSALAAAAEISFTLNNSFIASTDVVIVNIQSVGTAGAYFTTVGSVSNGACTITVGNTSTGSLSQALVLNFVVIKSVNN